MIVDCLHVSTVYGPTEVLALMSRFWDVAGSTCIP